MTDEPAPARPCAAQLVRDGSGGVTVLLDGHPQSYVDPSDPGLLAFEYMRHLGAVLDCLPPGRLAVTHVGGGGLTLPRYVQHTRPGSPQIVLEPDAALTEAVRRTLPLPRGHRIRVRPQHGRAGLAALGDGSADVVVLDAFTQGRVPADLTTRQALADVARVLGPGGTALLNLADEPGARYLARVLASLIAAGLPRLCLVATHDVLKGRRFGNTVVVASRQAPPEAMLRRRLAGGPSPSGLRAGADVTRLAASSRPLLDDDPRRSPPPPAPGRWTLR